MRSIKPLGLSLAAASLLLGGCSSSDSEPAPPQPVAQQIPNMGQEITPTAPPGAQFVTMNPGLADRPDWQVSDAASIVVSPDKTTMLVLTSGYNRVYAATTKYDISFNMGDSNEYVFIYDITKPIPVQKAVVQVPNTYYGMVFDPSGTAFYVSGCGDDNIHIISQNGDKTWPNISMSPVGVWSVPQSAANTLDLGHPFDPRDKTQSRQGNGLLYNAAPQLNSAITAVNAQVAVKPCGAGHRRRRC